MERIRRGRVQVLRSLVHLLHGFQVWVKYEQAILPLGAVGVSQ